MDNHRQPDALFTEFKREKSVRRAVTVLESKRKQIREELQQLVKHIALLVPLTGGSQNVREFPLELLQEALDRLEDQDFAHLLLQIAKELN